VYFAWFAVEIFLWRRRRDIFIENTPQIIFSSVRCRACSIQTHFLFSGQKNRSVISTMPDNGCRFIRIQVWQPGNLKLVVVLYRPLTRFRLDLNN